MEDNDQESVTFMHSYAYQEDGALKQEAEAEEAGGYDEVQMSGDLSEGDSYNDGDVKRGAEESDDDTLQDQKFKILVCVVETEEMEHIFNIITSDDLKQLHDNTSEGETFVLPDFPEGKTIEAYYVESESEESAHEAVNSLIAQHNLNMDTETDPGSGAAPKKYVNHPPQQDHGPNQEDPDTAAPLSYKCSLCSDSFFNYKDLKMHTRDHTDKEEYQCEHCEELLQGKTEYWRHVRRNHMTREEFRCEICDKRFSQRANLTKHLNIHLGVRKFQCNVCQKYFSQKANLKKHEVVHTGTYSFQCDICGKKFSQKANLNNHKKIHLGLYSHECQYCSKRFVQKVNCQKHVNTHHLKGGSAEVEIINSEVE